MPEDAGAGEKTEEPTPKKLRDARNEGQVAMSQEVTTSALLMVGFLALIGFAPLFYQTFAEILRRSLLEPFRFEADIPTAGALIAQAFHGPGLVLICFALFMALVAFIAVCSQIGLQVTWKPLVPKASKINPISGLQRLFGLRGLMKFVFNLAKLVLMISLAWWNLSWIIPEAIHFKADIAQQFADMSWTALLFVIQLVAVLLVVAIGDFIYQRWQHHKDMMMTKQEIKEEMKQSEGDPLVKAKIRQIQRQMAQQRMMQEVPKADVVITNPTHVAVALAYDRESMEAPTCVAKGYDHVAQRIKAIAAEHDIIQVENIDLARALAREVEVGESIPVDFFQQVAEILSYVYRLQGKLPAA